MGSYYKTNSFNQFKSILGVIIFGKFSLERAIFKVFEPRTPKTKTLCYIITSHIETSS